MKLAEITKKTDTELSELIKTERAALASAIIDSRTKEIKDVKSLSRHKKTIARALTIFRERAIAQEEATS